jgi:hypothetical protein
MDSWHATFLDLRRLRREVATFEIEAFFRFSAGAAHRGARRPELKLGLALRLAFSA